MKYRCPKCNAIYDYKPEEVPSICPACRSSQLIEQESSALIKCPYCAEYIRMDAALCRFCNRDLKTGDISSRMKVQIGVTDGIKFGIGLLIVLPLAGGIMIAIILLIVMMFLGSLPFTGFLL